LFDLIVLRAVPSNGGCFFYVIPKPISPLLFFAKPSRLKTFTLDIIQFVLSEWELLNPQLIKYFFIHI
jgi:hypothetical protein